MVIGSFEAVVVAGAVFAVGCSLTVDADRVQCEKAADCVALGFPDTQCEGAVCVGSTSFSCKGVNWPELSTERISVNIHARSLSDETPVPNLPVKVCNTIVDPSCATPSAEGVTGEDGTSTLDVPAGFRGHFFVPAAGESAPYILHMNPPPDPNGNEDWLTSTLTITNLMTLRGIAMVAQETFVEQRGHLFFTTYGCDGEAISGVRVGIADAPDEMVVAYLGSNGLPDQNLTDSGTGETGRGAIINLNPGFVTVQGFHDDHGKIFEQVMLIDEETITSTRILPSPF